jgi:hypothetical protein
LIVGQATLPVQPGAALLRRHLSITGWAKLRASSGLLSSSQAGKKRAGSARDHGHAGFEGEMTERLLFERKH